MKKILSIVTMALLVSACVAGGTGGGGNTGEVVKVDTPAAFKETKDVVIGGFTVGFDVDKTDSVKAGGGLMGSGFGGKSVAKSKLTGVSDSVMQQITDAAYKDFVSKLKAQGYTVVDRAQLMADAKFKDTKTYPSPYEDTAGGALGGGTKTKYFAPSSFGGLKVFLGDIQGVTGGIGFSNPGSAAAEYAKSAGVAVIHASFKVDFANSEKYGGFHTQSSSISVDQGVAVNPVFTRLGIIKGWGGTFSKEIGVMTLNHTLTSDKQFAQISDVTSGAYKATQVVTNVVGVLGGIGSNNSTLYEFKANPQAFKEAASEALEEASGVFVTKMVNLK